MIPPDAAHRFVDLLGLILMMMPAAGLMQTTLAQTPAGFEAAWRAVTQDHIDRLGAEGVIGAGLLFVHDGDVIGKAFHGYADAETQRRVDEATIYHWASITKTFTGIALMQLRDRGLLNLDDPIVDYLPELRAVHNPFGSMEALTLRHLMSHSAGFRAATWPWGGDEPWHPHEPKEWAQLVAMFPYTQLLFEPGSRFSYSNPGIIFLGRVIEQLTGDDYEVYIDKNILKPLGMHHSYFDGTPYHLLPYRSNNYSVVDGTVQANGLDFDTGITVSNGGLNASLTDMAKYLAFLVGAPGNEARYEGVLARSSLEEMWNPTYEVRRGDGITESQGLLFFIMEGEGLHVVGHTGSQKAFRLFFYIDPATHAGCLAAYNTVGITTTERPAKPDTDALMRAYRASLFDEVFPLFTPDP